MPSHPDKKILLLSVSAGAGHVRAAEALLAAATQQGLRARHIDIMDLVGAPLRSLYVDLYVWLVKHAPALWGMVYRLSDRASPTSLVGRFCRNAARLSSSSLLREVEAFDPDTIVCTHFLPAEILSGLKAAGQLRADVWVQVTDFDLHRAWVHPHMRGYFAASDRVARRLRALGVAPASIYPNAIPVMPAFATPAPRRQCAQALWLDPNKTTVLLMGGGAGLGRLDEVAERLLRQFEHVQLIVVAGRNTALLHALSQLASLHTTRLRVFGFTDQVANLMACADLVVTKPGGLTSAECLAMGLPMIANQPIPGQEMLNADYLRDQGVALTALDPCALGLLLQHLLANPAKLEAMRQRARNLGCAEAARILLATLLKHPPLPAPMAATPTAPATLGDPSTPAMAPLPRMALPGVLPSAAQRADAPAYATNLDLL